MRTIIAIPVYNEQKTVRRVLAAVRERADRVLVIDDGSTDATPQILEKLREPLGLDVIRHHANAGYGRSIREAFAFAHRHGYDWVVTMDCDEQHEPESIPAFLARAAADDLDIISGTRYARVGHPADDAVGAPPPDRRAINAELTRELNERLAGRLSAIDPARGLTDAFCGFKAHRVEAMARLALTENGYAFPMQLWVQAAAERLRIGEIPVRLIYNDPNRTFGGGLDDAHVRLNHYRCVMYREIERLAPHLPSTALIDARTKCPES